MKKITFYSCSEEIGYGIINDEEYTIFLEKAKNAREENAVYDYSYCADGDDLYIDRDISGKDILEAFEDAENISEDEYKILEKHDCVYGGNLDISDLLVWLDDNFETKDERKTRLIEEAKEKEIKRIQKEKKRNEHGNERYFSDNDIKDAFPNGICDFNHGDRHYCAIFKTKLEKAGDIVNSNKVGNIIQRTPIFHVKADENPNDVAVKKLGMFYRAAVDSIKNIPKKYKCEFSHEIIKLVECGLGLEQSFNKLMESLNLFVESIEFENIEKKRGKIHNLNELDFANVKRIMPSFKSKINEVMYLANIDGEVFLIDYSCECFDQIDSKFKKKAKEDYKTKSTIVYNTYFTDLADEDKSMIYFDLYNSMIFKESFIGLEFIRNSHTSLCGLVSIYTGEWFIENGKIHFTTGCDHYSYMYKSICDKETSRKLDELEDKEKKLSDQFESRRNDILKKLKEEYDEEYQRLEDEYFSL